MFPWNIAKSAEAMFSRWAIKRVCQFLLKKKLGQFILGDIDLNQLDVQLAAGKIQLSDLALNVDYINQKFGDAAAVVVKEGSVGSLLVTMPWMGKGCEIEVEELELVLAPCRELNIQFGSEACVRKQDDNDGIGHDAEKLKNEKVENATMSASVDVHEGVKTIAKMVKWLLTSFHVKVKKLIVAFDSSSIKNGKNREFCRTLVLRITEVECGTRISEEATLNADATVDNFLGLNQLTNFLKFHGAILEILQMDGVDNETLIPCDSGTTFGEWSSTCCPSNARTVVVSGERGGFSGTLKLSIPWKNGSLDIRKVDADAYIDPLELRFHPSSMKWLLYMCNIFKESGKNRNDPADCKNMESVYLKAASRFCPSTLGTCVTSNDKVMLSNESSPSDCCSPRGKETLADALLPDSQLISDWVPDTIRKNQKDKAEEEPDFGASVEQFFECFDGLRNSQSALGNSGMWNWTCSVFSAITAASNLASGALPIPSEQQHVETNLKATIAGITVLFSLIDGDQKHSCDLTGDQTNVRSYAHYLGAKFQDISLILQVCPQEMKFRATVEYFELNDHFNNGDDAVKFGLHSCNGIESHVLLVQEMQDAVQGSLPSFSSSAKSSGSQKPNRSVAADFPFTSSPMGSCIRKRNCKGIYRDDAVKVTLLRSSGGTQCQFSFKSSASNDHLKGPTSFSLQLPPLVFWVNFHLINKVLGLLNEVGESFEVDKTAYASTSEDSNSQYCSSSHGDVKRSSRPCLTTLSPKELLRGDIFLPTARILLCFPCEKDGDSGSYSTCNQFIALDFTSPLTSSDENVQVASPLPNAGSQRRYSSTTSQSLHLNVGNLHVYFITSTANGNIGSYSGGPLRQSFFSENILSAMNSRGHLSVIRMIWQDGPVTGPWIAKRAKLLASSKDSRGKNRFVGEGYEFASVSTAKDMEETSKHAQQEIILSSTFILHAYLSPVKINLSSSQYEGLYCLSLQAIDGLSFVAHDPGSRKTDSDVSQTSIVVECDSVEISLGLEKVESIEGSIESELPGSWDHFNLQINKFQWLSVSHIGGINGANFLWVAHCEGNLWGAITGVPNKEFLLISCRNSSMGRGDGEGSNALSSKFPGSDIIHLQDPQTSCSDMSITIRCSTIVAIGGRLDWLERVSSFFSLPSPEIEQAGDPSLNKGNPVKGLPCESSFALNLVDVGVSYEPCSKGLMVCEVSDSESSSVNANERIHEHYVACLLAASSLKLSNKQVADSIINDYKISVEDIGLLLRTVTGSKDLAGTYSAEHLQKVGYVKVARGELVEAILRINATNGLWELEGSKYLIFLDTCRDTTSGLIQLAGQLQLLFAPDLEESVVHLQTRWNNVQKEHESDGTRILSCDSAPSTSQMDTARQDMKTKPGTVNLMDEICEDAFHLDGHWGSLSGSSESQLHIPVDDGLIEDTYNLRVTNPESFAHDVSLACAVPLDVMESSQASLKFIEGYFLTELCSLSERSQERQSTNGIPKYKSRNKAKADVEKVYNGWYGDASLKILEDHASGFSSRTRRQLVATVNSASNCDNTDDYGKLRGLVFLKNINVVWRMYAGSDWHNFQKNVQNSSTIRGRDRTVCLELALSGMDFQYEIYPEGEICVSRLSLSVQDFHVNDNSHDAPWKLVVGNYQSKDHPRKSSSKAFKLDLEAVRPDPLTPLEEYRLRIAFLPILLHLHQSQLDFLISFFGGNSSSVDQSLNAPQDSRNPEMLTKENRNFGSQTISKEALLPYFQKLDMWPVLIRVDYIPCRVDLAALRGGKYVELVNLVPWKGVELQLKHVHGVGVYGWSSVCETIIGEWLEDISQNQIRKLLRGLPPIRSLVSVGSGASKLVSLPVKSYKKDHRLLKGMQRGTIAFLRSISLEAVGLGVHLAAGAHDILLQAEYILASIPPSVPWPVQSRTYSNVRSNQPKNARQGIQQAYESISDGLGKSASALVRTPLKRYQRGAGAGSAFVTAVQAAPAAAIAPASAAARAMHCALLGVRNSLDPEHGKESIEKYLGVSQPEENTTEH